MRSRNTEDTAMTSIKLATAVLTLTVVVGGTASYLGLGAATPGLPL